MKLKNRRFLRIGMLCVLLLTLQQVALAQDSGVAAGTSSIEGKITGADGKTPVRGAVVLAYHLSTEQIYRSEGSNAKGEFQISGVPYGYYDLAVDTRDGQFVGNQVVSVAPAGKVAVVFSLTPFVDQASRQDARPFPGSETTSQGLARVDQKLAGRDFWRSPRGVAIMGGAGGAVLLAIASGGGGGGSASPFQP